MKTQKGFEFVPLSSKGHLVHVATLTSRAFRSPDG